MQTEARFRLLREDEIVGWLKFESGENHQWKVKTKQYDWGVHSCEYDVLEHGIKQGDTWFYEGDIVTGHAKSNPYILEQGTVVVSPIGEFQIKWDEDGCILPFDTYYGADTITPTGCTIHDKEASK